MGLKLREITSLESQTTNLPLVDFSPLVQNNKTCKQTVQNPQENATKITKASAAHTNHDAKTHSTYSIQSCIYRIFPLNSTSWVHNDFDGITIRNWTTFHLVGGFSPTHLKNIISSKWVNIFPKFRVVKIKNIWVATTQFHILIGHQMHRAMARIIHIKWYFQKIFESFMDLRWGSRKKKKLALLSIEILVGL